MKKWGLQISIQVCEESRKMENVRMDFDGTRNTEPFPAGMTTSGCDVLSSWKFFMQQRFAQEDETRKENLTSSRLGRWKGETKKTKNSMGKKVVKNLALAVFTDQHSSLWESSVLVGAAHRTCMSSEYSSAYWFVYILIFQKSNFTIGISKKNSSPSLDFCFWTRSSWFFLVNFYRLSHLSER